jgi:putative membrane protein
MEGCGSEASKKRALFAIVFLVVLKSAISWVWGVVGIVLFGILMMLGIKLYKNIRKKNNWEN